MHNIKIIYLGYSDFIDGYGFGGYGGIDFIGGDIDYGIGRGGFDIYGGFDYFIYGRDFFFGYGRDGFWFLFW
ncbi:unnamed protein product, partial [Rotaria sp. Silwood2]